MLQSRKISKEKFVSEFLDTITEGIIPRTNFIDWVTIDTTLANYRREIKELQKIINENQDIYEKLRDYLENCNNPEKIIKLCFLLLGHTPDTFVSEIDSININKLTSEVRLNKKETIDDFLQLLKDLKFQELFHLICIDDYLKGVMIGLETHKRKGVGGKFYINTVKNQINQIVNQMNLSGLEIQLSQEERIVFDGNGEQLKIVDFALKQNDKIRIGIEVNFYTNTGSKPTEIKRSYVEINRKLNEKNIELIWITDGHGYKKMKKSLGDAFDSHPNIYNTYMVKKYLLEDLMSFFNLNQ